jgi:predicted GIY-YIG superfamily endonuclease
MKRKKICLKNDSKKESITRSKRKKHKSYQDKFDYLFIKKFQFTSQWVCYVLKKEKNGSKTYVGKTNNMYRRIRQHRGIISGGARRTKNQNMVPMCIISGFHEEAHVLQFEWALKRASNRKGYSKFCSQLPSIVSHTVPRKFLTATSGPYKRVRDIYFLMTMKNWTKAAPETSSFRLHLHWMLPGFKLKFKHDDATQEMFLCDFDQSVCCRQIN